MIQDQYDISHEPVLVSLALFRQHSPLCYCPFVAPPRTRGARPIAGSSLPYSMTACDTALSKSYSSDRPAGPCTKSTTAMRSFRFTHQYVPYAPDQP